MYAGERLIGVTATNNNGEDSAAISEWSKRGQASDLSLKNWPPAGGKWTRMPPRPPELHGSDAPLRDPGLDPNFGRNKPNPSRDVYKTKADVVKQIQQALANGAGLIQQQGDAGLGKVTKTSIGDRLVHKSYTWMFAIDHSGQLVAYYRANNLVPPDSRQ